MNELYVELAIPGTADKLYTYSVPAELMPAARRGARVIASFGKRTVIGFIVETSAESQTAAERGRSIPHIKPIQDVLDVEPILSEQLLNLTSWIAEYYLAPLGEVLKAVLVQGAVRPGKRIVSLEAPSLQAAMQQVAHAPRQAEILRELSQRGPATIQQLKKHLGARAIYSPLNELARRGFVRILEEQPKPQLKSKTEAVIEVTPESRQIFEQHLALLEASSRRSPGQAAILRALTSTINLPSAIAVTDLLKQSGSALSALRALARKRILTITSREVIRKTEFDLYPSSLGTIEITLNDYQRNAFECIRQSLEENKFQTFLLHGVTGSGKTQVYIESMHEALARKRSAILLVPEISLTPQIVRRFKYHFGENVIVLHSRMSIGERYDAWRAAWERESSIVIGPRSAIFAPLRNVGLIVVDEEQEPSYKQADQAPRYHARDVAIVRAAAAHAVVILGSATPSLETYTNAVNNKYSLLELPERIDTAKLPEVKIVDMLAERQRKLEEFREAERQRKKEADGQPHTKKPPERDILSDTLRRKISDRLEKNEGIILLQNRRGFASYVECPDCGWVEMCENCNISLTYHATKKHLRCHYCGLVRSPAETCPQCRSAEIRYHGVGTQRVEEELARSFPKARLLRMDLDTTTRRGSHDAILKKFSEGEADILLGTQMIAKGLDFSRVTLVGVISADTQMLLPDFRASERTFQLLTQVAGRAGRSALRGEVIIQTGQPDNPTLRYIAAHDYIGFYRDEIEHRKELCYPPFSRIILIEFRGKQDEEVMHHASEFMENLTERRQSIQVLGPASAALSKLKGVYRWHIILKSLKTDDPGGHILHKVCHEAVHLYRNSRAGKSRSVKMIIDVDPASMM